jgi:hypothetical protein
MERVPWRLLVQVRGSCCSSTKPLHAMQHACSVTAEHIRDCRGAWWCRCPATAAPQKAAVHCNALSALSEELASTPAPDLPVAACWFVLCIHCNSSRLASFSTSQQLLLLLLQVYTIVTATLDNSSPPGRTAVCELLEKLQEPVAYMQELFQPISSRVSQVGLREVAAACHAISASMVSQVRRTAAAALCHVMPASAGLCLGHLVCTHMSMQYPLPAVPADSLTCACLRLGCGAACCMPHARAMCPPTSQCAVAAALLPPVRSWSWLSVQCWIMWLQLQCWSAPRCLMCHASGRRSWESRACRRSAHLGRRIAGYCY